MFEYFLSPAKADLLPTNGGSSACSNPPGYGPAHRVSGMVISVLNLWSSSAVADQPETIFGGYLGPSST